MPKRRSRVIIDTNIWISFLLTNNLSRLDKLFTQDVIVLLFSEELLEEFIEVSKRPKFKKYFSQTDMDFLLSAIHNKAILVDVKSRVKQCRDSQDDFLLSLAKDGKADYLITGDKDLLDIGAFGKTQIISIAGFLAQNAL